MGYTDPRRNQDSSRVDSGTHKVGPAIFTANAGGSTTTLVGADGVLATGVNVIRKGERGVIHKSDGTERDGTEVEITTLASASGTTTLTFSPAIDSATASGDTFHPVANQSFADNASMDDRLLALGFSQSYIDSLSQNDKVYQIRLSDDAGSL
jgi:hypothetical protein